MKPGHGWIRPLLGGAKARCGGPSICPQCEFEARVVELEGQNRQLDGLLNSPEVDDFLKGVKLEAGHQVKRWGAAHDRQKSAEHWFWLVGYLAGKALRSALQGDKDKARHHCISSAAALAHWHEAISRDTTGSGMGRDADLEAYDNGKQAHETAPAPVCTCGHVEVGDTLSGPSIPCAIHGGRV